MICASFFSANRIVNIWNRHVLSAETVNCFNTIEYRFRLHRDVMYEFSLWNSRNRTVKYSVELLCHWTRPSQSVQEQTTELMEKFWFCTYSPRYLHWNCRPILSVIRIRLCINYKLQQMRIESRATGNSWFESRKFPRSVQKFPLCNTTSHTCTVVL